MGENGMVPHFTPYLNMSIRITGHVTSPALRLIPSAIYNVQLGQIMEAGYSGGQSSPWTVAPRGKKEVGTDQGRRRPGYGLQDRDIRIRFPERQRIFPSSVFLVNCLTTAYGLDDQGVGVRVQVGSRIFSPQRPDRLWVSRNLLSNGYRG
jgi:hypothetical protein